MNKSDNQIELSCVNGTMGRCVGAFTPPTPLHDFHDLVIIVIVRSVLRVSVIIIIIILFFLKGVHRELYLNT